MACCCLAMGIMTGQVIWESVCRLASICAGRTEHATRSEESVLQVDPFAFFDLY